MRRSFPFAALAATFALAACQDGPVTAPGDASLSRSENAPLYIVTFKPGVDVDAATADLARGNGFATHSVRHHAAPGFTAAIPEARLSHIVGDPRVEIVEKDYIVTLDLPRAEARPPSGGGGSQSTPWGITRVGG